MKLNISLFGLFLIANLGNSIFGQGTDVPIGNWKEYLPFSTFQSISQSEDQVFATTGLGVIAVNKLDLEKSFLSKLTGLSATCTKLVKYIPSQDGLIVTYDDNEFDLVLQNRTVTYDNIKKDGSFFNREILDVEVLKDDVVYFCTGFGIVEFFPALQTFGFTLDLGAPVYGITYKDNRYYAASEEGVLTAPDDPTINLKDISNWTFLYEDDGFPLTYEATSITNHNDLLYVSMDSVLYKYENDILDTILFEPGYFVQYVSAEGPNLLIGLFCKAEGCNGRLFYIDLQGQKTEYTPSPCVARPIDAVEDQFGQLWASDRFTALRIGRLDTPANCNQYKNDSRPERAEVFEVTLRGNEVWLTSNGISSTTFAPQFNRYGVLAGIDGTWYEFGPNTAPGLEGNDGKAYHRILADNNTGNIYVGTNSEGLLIADADNNFTLLDNTSALDFGADPNNVRVAGMALDDEGNLWMANNSANKPIVVLTPDGNTTNNFSDEVPQGAALRDVAIDFSGYKWFTRDKNGLLVYDDNGTLNIKNDDNVRIIKTTTSLLPSNLVRCIEVDLDGEVWVGTELGVISFNCGSGVFDVADCQGFLQVVEVDGFRANLLETEDVRAIAVDGANRKWFGTTNGVFLMSPNGKEQLAFFNSANSPLPDNFINDIKIHPETGEVFFATGKGLVSFRGEATEGAPFHNEQNAYAYPNPVRPDYRGPIAIKGLTRDADIKITDVNGQLIYATQALGGQVVWDGNDYNGRRATSGVYYIFSTSDDNFNTPNTLVTKLLFIN